jgi:hypothetical protein
LGNFFIHLRNYHNTIPENRQEKKWLFSGMVCFTPVADLCHIQILQEILLSVDPGLPAFEMLNHYSIKQQ